MNKTEEQQIEHAHRWATELACGMAKKFYPEVPQWEPLPDLLGIITQIDNMVTGLVRAPVPDVCCGEYEACNKACVPRANHWKNHRRVFRVL